MTKDVTSYNKCAVVFPGQGAQRPGMGKDFYENISVCRETYQEASDALGWDIGKMCFGEDERLNLTEYTQPCILTTEIAMLRGLNHLYGFSPDIFGGHSLGEFTALVAAGVLSLKDAVKIVNIRGRLMQDAVPVGVGAMAAVISENLDIGFISDIMYDLALDIANINSSKQIVISGESSAISIVEERLMKALPTTDKGFRFVLLNVSAPFHSRFMSIIVEDFRETLRAIGNGLIHERAVRLTSNYTGSFHTGRRDDLENALVYQLDHTVLWLENMKNIASMASSIYELGPSRPLRDFFRTIDVSCTPITTLSSAERIFS